MSLNSDTRNWRPIGEIAQASGYTASAQIQTNRKNNDTEANFQALSLAADEIIKNPVKMRMLADRVYQLMLEDLQNQRERSRNYGGLF